MAKNARIAIGETLISWLIPLTMAFLSVTLEGLANRTLNIVLGGFFTLYGIFHIAKCPIVHISKNPRLANCYLHFNDCGSCTNFLVCMELAVFLKERETGESSYSVLGD
jgi:hypothetical protein